MRYTYPEEISCLPNFMVWWWWWWWWDCALVVSSVFYSIYGVSAAVPALLTSDFSVVVCPLSVLQDAERRTRLLGLLVEVMYGLLWLMAYWSRA